MNNLDSKTGTRIAKAIDDRIIAIAKQVYQNSPNDKIKYGKVVGRKNGIFTVKIESSTYEKIPALRNVGNIQNGEVVLCLIPNNNFSNMTIIGVADGTLSQGDYILPQASEFVLGGIKAKAKTSETNEVKIDTTTGLLYASSVGEQGPEGPTGPQGDAATISVGTVTTLPAGSNATVTNVGTESDAIFNFGIPQGEQGPATIDIVDNLDSTDTNAALSANQGRVLNETKQNFYDWHFYTETQLYSNSGSITTHTLDLSTLPDWEQNAYYDVLIYNESYNADTSYMLVYTDLLSSTINVQRFSTNGRQGGAIYRLPAQRYIYYKITNDALDTLIFQIRGIRRYK